ncbi:hypothetical protein SAMN00120144_2104 [Hymenobacter roseosalivarius DSM 11622]|uniref:AAA ATPase n=2 Tax=Hymenobacter roseosalivarius TaxID=89967 RepID=A0A1W1VGT1_9BACT|nr:hypothetical protein SAMN00120144_2104 [Hymenobacter roseosalivarius DSM 11622]
MRLLLQGPSGAGKTMGALLIAHGLAGGDWTKVAVIDTENGSADLYADLGEYRVLRLTAPFTPERYAEALGVCEQAGMQVIILDSITPEWEHLLDYHASLPGNSFSAWAKVTPRHTAFIQRLLLSPAHIIATVRAKTEYLLAEKNGKQVPEKVGLKSIQREGLDYEFTLVFEVDLRHQATATKDRTRLYSDQVPVRLCAEVGETLRQWCQTGTQPKPEEGVLRAIGQCRTLAELTQLYHSLPVEQQTELKAQFQAHKYHLQVAANTSNSPIPLSSFLHPQPQPTYGNLATRA